MPYEFGPKDALNFAKRSGQICIDNYDNISNIQPKPMRALDIGCAVGGASSTISSFTAANPTVWYAGASLPTKTWVSVVYGNGRFVALASDGSKNEKLIEALVL
jgi:hypothetical protein